MPSTPENPLADFQYCPRCGAAGLSLRGVRSVRCAECDFLFYLNCAAAVCGLVFHQGKLLLCVRAKAPQQGALDWPGGFIEFDETAEDALRREVREELNIEIENLRYLMSAPNNYLYAGMLYKTLDVFFTAEAKDIASIAPRDDVAGYKLLALEAIAAERLAFDSGRLALQKLSETVGISRLSL
jgi:ADP-ribose pyrophosphatase YjhB (NUDIX family)